MKQNVITTKTVTTVTDGAFISSDNARVEVRTVRHMPGVCVITDAMRNYYNSKTLRELSSFLSELADALENK